MTYKIFISSVQKEFAQERRSLAAHIREHALLHEYFTVYLFEETAAAGAAPDTLYLDEVEQSDVYVGIFGREYGYEFEDGESPTEKEYKQAAELHKERWVYIYGDATVERHVKMKGLIGTAGSQVARKRVLTQEELLREVEKSAFTFLKQKGVIASTEFDNSLHDYATIGDLSAGKVTEFLTIARAKRNFPLAVTSQATEVLTHLGMMRSGKVCNSALLVFTDHPQKYFPTATVKCAHFHGYEVSKPIPDLKEFDGTAMEMAHQATSFVLSKISQRTGDRSESNRVDTSYEIPRAVVAEAIVNAIAHRDYRSTASIQVSVFRDRVEVWNPGTLPPELSINKLKEAHGSFPRNPLLAKCLFNMGEIERYGTGTKEMFDLIDEVGLKPPTFSLDNQFQVTLYRREQVGEQVSEQVSEQVGEQVKRLVVMIEGEMKTKELMEAVSIASRRLFKEDYLDPAININLVEMTNPESPNSPKQKYRLTKTGLQYKNELSNRK